MSEALPQASPLTLISLNIYAEIVGFEDSTFHLLSGVCRIEKNEDGTFTVHLDSKGKASSVKVGVVMFGTGRKPNSREIGLEVGLIGPCIACRDSVPKMFEAQLLFVQL